MHKRVVERPEMILLGVGFFGDPFKVSADWTEENEIGRTWKRFMTFLTDRGDPIRHAVEAKVAYELHVYHPETLETGEFEVFVGLEVARLERVPVELSAKILPPARCASFTLEGTEISSDWHLQVFSEWLPEMGLEGQHTYSIQRYDERFKGLDRMDESVLEVLIPVK